MKISQKVLSIIFLFLMTVVLLAVLAFYYFSLGNILEKSANCSLVKPVSGIASVEEEKMFLNYDVLALDLLCENDKKWESWGGVGVFNEGCISTRLPFGDDHYLQKLKIVDYDFNNMLLTNNTLGYRLILNDDMEIFNDIMTRYEKHEAYMNEIVAENDSRRKSINQFNVQAIFDQKNPEIAYVLFSINEQVFWGDGEHIAAGPDLVAYSGELVVYKYDLLKDDFEILYNVSDIVDANKNIILENVGDKMHVPANLRGIDNENNLLIADARYYNMTGLGGGDIAFNVGGISAWTQLYLLKAGKSELEEFKYHDNDNYYNSDLFDLLIFEYYPEHIDMKEYGMQGIKYTDF